jgi:hypothetical protein
MRYSVCWPVFVAFMIGVTGCAQEAPPEKPACSLSMDTLNDTVWLMADPQADKTTFNNPMARLKFYDDAGVQKVKYTVKSISDVYDYTCEQTERELVCKEKAKPKDWCQSLEVFRAGACNVEALRKFGATGTDEELTKAVEEGRKTVAGYRNTKDWDHFKLNNNNLGNKLQGQLYAKVNTRRCNLTITDMYMTIYDGKKVEDSNPVGTNPFERSEEEYLWEHCDDGLSMADLETAEQPRLDVPNKGAHALANPVYYHYLGKKNIKPEEGCSYSMDTWAQWRRAGTNIAVTPDEKGKLYWTTSHTWQSLEKQPVGIFNMLHYKTCADGKREKINSLCNVIRLQ